MIHPRDDAAPAREPLPEFPPQAAAEVATPLFPDVPEVVPLRRRGPGVWESLAWMIGMHLTQVLASVAAILALVGTFVVSAVNGTPGDTDSAAVIRAIIPYFEAHLVTIVGVAQLGSVLFGLLAVRVRFGAHGVRDLGLRCPAASHALLVGLLMFPLWFLCSVLQSELFQWFPDSHREMEQLLLLMSQAPLPILVLVIGIGPALGEELLFRGLIGRGLVARHGLVRGMLITSFLFGVMHINPGQSLAVIPMGLAMHFVYCTTRSFWMPMLLHFLNNSLSAVILKHGEHPLVATLSQALEGQGSRPLPLLVASVAMVTAILILLWQTRVQYVLPDGTAWDPGYPTTASPPVELGAVPLRQPPRLLMLAGSAVNSLGFAAGLWRLTGWAGLPL